MRHTQETEPVGTERAQMGDKGKTNNIRNANAPIPFTPRRHLAQPRSKTANSQLQIDTIL